MNLDELSGLLDVGIGDALRDLAAVVPADQAIVEIGSFRGKSTAYLAQGSKDGHGAPVFAIDPWDLPGNVYGKHGFTAPEVREVFESQLRAARLWSRVTPIKAFSVDAASAWSGPPIGLLFIDGDHTEPAIRADLAAWTPHLAHGRRDRLRRLRHEAEPRCPPRRRLARPHGADRRRPSRSVSMRLSAAVMAHPKRTAMVDELLEDLDRPVPVVWDQINDRHDTGIRAIEAYDPAATHHLVIQDDVIVPRDLLAGIERALVHIPPDAPLSLYVGRVRPFSRAVRNAVAQAGSAASWLTMQGIYWGPGIVLPTGHIPALSKWYRGDEGQQVTNYDRRVSAWFALHNATAWYTWPSLVDHRDEESLVKGHGAGRCAHAFIGTDRSALDVDWSGPAVDIPRTAQMDDARQLRAQRARRAEARQRQRVRRG